MGRNREQGETPYLPSLCVLQKDGGRYSCKEGGKGKKTKREAEKNPLAGSGGGMYFSTGEEGKKRYKRERGKGPLSLLSNYQIVRSLSGRGKERRRKGVNGK